MLGRRDMFQSPASAMDAADAAAATAAYLKFFISMYC